MVVTCCSTGMGSYCPCFSTSTVRAPRSSWRFVAASRSDANDENASSSRYCARSRRRRPATERIAFTCADPPTRRSEEHTSELQSHSDLVCRLLLEKKKKKHI